MTPDRWNHSAVGEETGWRGYAWQRLRERRSLAQSAVRLAVPWAVWHIPLVLVDGGMRGFSIAFFPMFVVSLAVGAVVLG